ncbi:MAG: PKD domain-containing protein [Polyangiaceae bacterium]
MRLRVFAPSAAFVMLAVSSFSNEGRADPGTSINLLGPPHYLKMQSQTDWRWSGFSVGPQALALQADENGPIDMGRCGCLLTSLSTAFESIGAGNPPWYPSKQVVKVGQGLGFGSVQSFSPRYIDQFLNGGPNLPPNRPDGWGYQPGSGGKNCGVAIWPLALAGLAEAKNPFPSGMTWVRRSWSWWTRTWYVDAALKAGIPTVIVRKTYKDAACTEEGKGRHANLIVGWNAADDPAVPAEERGKYLVFDPMWSPTGSLSDAKVAGLPCGGDIEDSYQKWDQSITSVYPLDPVTGPAADWMLIKDDPEPIKLRLTDPKGRRTGYDPLTGENLQEDASAFYDEFTSFADPLLLFPEAPVYRYIAAKNPEPGGYGLEVFGIGDGPFTLTLSTASVDQQTDAATVEGDIVAGETRRYEIERASNGTVKVAPVDAFAPRARAGNDASAFLGGTVTFDGRGSYQIGGELASHSWDFGDQTSATGPQQAHAYSAAGTYTATLTVTSADGLTATDERTVLVIDPASLPAMETLCVSVTSASAQGSGASFDPQVTPDGRYVVFESTASDLVPDDTNASPDVFLKDLSTGAIERVSVATGGAEAISGLGFALNQRAPRITPDGRFVFFASDATNLSPGDTELTLDLYVRDRTLGTTELVLPYDTAAWGSELVSISADARYVAFGTPYNLVPEDVDVNVDLYVLDRLTATLERVAAGGGAPHMSADGNLIAFAGAGGVFVLDRQAGTTELVSLDAAAAPITGTVYLSSMSADGRHVVFGTDNNNVVPGDNNAGNFDLDVFVRDRLLGTTEQVSVSSTGEGANSYAASSGISADGRYVAFLSFADNLAPGGTTSIQVYLRDLQDKTTVRASVDTNGIEAVPGVTSAGTPVYPLSVALDGAVVFEAYAANLVPNDTNGARDVFIRRPVPMSGAATTPIANLGGPYLGWASSAAVPAGIRLDASASADPEDRPLTAHWDFGDRSPVLDGALVTTHAYASPGVYKVTVTVSAEDDTSEAITTAVEVMPALAPDALSAGACAPPEGTLSLTGAAVTANGSLVAEGWDTTAGKIPIQPAILTLPWGDVTAPTSLPGLTFRQDTTVPAKTKSGSYEATTPGAKDALFTVPCATRANQQPAAVAGGPLCDTGVGGPVTLDGSASSDGEGSPLAYRWDFGDGTTGEGATPAHTYTFEGSYMVTLIVNDGTEDSADMIGTHSFAMVLVSPGAPAPTDPRSEASGGGCGCSAAPRDAPVGFGACIGLLLLARRRRRRAASCSLS